MIARLMSPFPMCIYTLFLSITGLTLTGISLLGLAEYPSIPYGLEEFMKYTMMIGFAMFLATPVGIYLWSIQKGYLRTNSAVEVAVNVLVIMAFALVVAMGALGSLYPAWRASRTRPVEALKNE